jgi:hypothetical protein
LKKKYNKILFPNFVENAKMLQWAGIDFGEEEV